MMTASSIKYDENGQLKPVHVFKEGGNLPVTAYNKGEKYPPGKAGAMSDEEVRRANEGSAETIRKSIFKKV